MCKKIHHFALVLTYIYFMVGLFHELRVRFFFFSLVRDRYVKMAENAGYLYNMLKTIAYEKR